MAAPAGTATLPEVKPETDPDTEFYWEGLRQHRLLLQCCRDCGRHRFPPMPSCPYCSCIQSSVVQSKGQGTVYSWIVVRKPWNPEFAARIPYTIATIDLTEGVRVVACLENIEPRPGLRVTARFHDHDSWTELRFGPGE